MVDTNMKNAGPQVDKKVHTECDLLMFSGDSEPAQYSYDPQVVARLRRLIPAVPKQGRIIILCAESGMNKTGVVMGLLKEWRASGFDGSYYNLSGQRSSQLTHLFRALARSMSEDDRSSTHLIIIDDAPVYDERELDRQVRALTSLAVAGQIIIVCLYPEAIQFIEELPSALCVHSEELVIDSLFNREDKLWLYTYGIPLLIPAVQSMKDLQNIDRPLQDVSFRVTFTGLITKYLRASLPSEELCLRLAMMLLGSGDYEDLVAVIEHMDSDALIWIQRDAPLFGVDATAGTFHCIGLDTADGLAVCLNYLRSACDRESLIASRCAQTLIHRGDMRRAALVCGLCRQEDFIRIVSEWGVEFICSGEDALVHRALSLRTDDSPQVAGLSATEMALSVISDPVNTMKRFSTEMPPRSAPLAVRRRYRYLELLQACRDIDRGVAPGRVALARDDDDMLSRMLVDHIMARQMLMEGCVVDAYELLLNSAVRLNPTTLPAALACDDFEIAEALLGEEPTSAEQQAFKQAGQLLCHMHSGRFRTYRQVLERMLAVLTGSYCYADLESAIARAEFMGDRAIQAVLLLAAAVADNRSRAYARSHIRSRAVCAMAGDVATPYVINSAQLIDALACAGLEDMTKLRMLARAGNRGVAHDLATLATTEFVGGDTRIELTVLPRTSIPRSDLWLLNVMCNDCKEPSSQLFKRNAPQLWQRQSRQAVRLINRQIERALLGTQETGTATKKQAQEEQSATQMRPVELKLLGGFEVKVNGVNVAGRLEKRKARQVLTLLGSLKNHKMSRFEMIDSLWLDNDYTGATQRVYEATSLLRSVFRKDGNLKNIIVTNRSDSSITLDMSYISCDVDTFEQAALRALDYDGANDDVAVNLACEATSLYAGDLIAIPQDGRGIVATRRDELQELFIDVAVLGATKALAVGQISLAMRLAHRAVGVNNMREDAVYLLVETLKLSGRMIDAWDVYQNYAQQLLEKSSIPPSRAMRKLVEDIAPSRGRRSKKQQAESLG